MARKNRPVLFEVVSRTQRPRRWGGFPRRPPASSNATPGGAAPPAAPAPVSPREPAPLVSSVETDVGWHIVLRLGWPHLVVAGVFLVMLMYASFALGRRSVAPAVVRGDDLTPILAPGPTEPPAKTPPAPSPGRGSSTVVTPQTRPAPPAPPAGADRPAEKQAAAPKTAAPAHTFAEGAYYVVVQYFSSARKKDAEEARDFLAGKGVSCVVHQGPARDWWLVATEPFSSAQQAQRLVARIRDLGKEYFTIGRYDFRDPVARKF